MDEGLHAAALRALTARALSERELGEKLERRGFSPEAVRAELARLMEAGLLDDLEVARGTCRGRLARGYGRQVLPALLRRRGLGGETVDAVLHELEEDVEEQALAVAVEKAARRWDLDSLDGRRKVLRHLLRRGFGVSEAHRALSRWGRDGADG